MEDPQFHSREMLVNVPHPVLGMMPMVGIAPKLSETPGQIRTAGPALGEHNKEVYARLMGYTEKDLDALRKEGVV
jgi:formyl-CoA transferase